MKQKSPFIFQDNFCCVEQAIHGAAKHFSKRMRITFKDNYIMSMVEERAVGLVRVRTMKIEAVLLTEDLPLSELKTVLGARKLFD